jgi:hypothetical protein
MDMQIEEDDKPPELVGPLPSSDVRFDWKRDPHRGQRITSLWRSIPERADVLFGLRRAWDGFSARDAARVPGGYKNFNNRQPFRLVHSEFIRHARKMRPERPDATVSAFASWLYSLYSNAYGDEEDRERGKALEPAIFERRKTAQGSVNDEYLRSIGSEWRLVHNGLHLPGQDAVAWFSFDHLRVNGEALRASPDLIYHHPRLNEVMIVEIKHSFMEIPSNLWPNLWGQLWCYSQLDIARSANRVTVIGEVWAERTHGRRRESGGVYLRACERRDPRVPAYDRFFRTLFEIYSER